MSEPRKYRVRSRISQLAFSGGGISVQTALRNAEMALEAMKPPSLADLDACVAEIQARFGAGAERSAGANLEALYALSSRIIEASFALPEAGVEQAARSLCDLADACITLGAADWPAIDVHIDGLVMLRAHGQKLPEQARASVLDGLAKVARRRVAEQAALASDATD